MMNDALSILTAYRKGEIGLSECWDLLRGVPNISPKRNEPKIQAKPSRVYEPLNAAELRAIEFLQRVNFGVWNSASRFVHQIKDAKELTARQRDYLRLLVYKFRRQIFRKPDRDARAKTYIERMKQTADSQ